MKAKCFHELFFNGLFGRLVFRSKSAGGETEFLLQKDTKSLWRAKHLYLLLPLEKLNGICEGALQINWHGIDSCASAIEFLRRRYSLVTGDCDDNGIVKSPQDTSSVEMEYVGTNKIHFANCVLDADNIKNTLVLAIHTGKIYCIIDIDSNLFPESSFCGNNEKSKEHVTYSDYFSKRCIICFTPPDTCDFAGLVIPTLLVYLTKQLQILIRYGITLRHPRQALLLLKQSHNPHNLLFNFHEEGSFFLIQVFILWLLYAV